MASGDLPKRAPTLRVPITSVITPGGHLRISVAYPYGC
jgi:hypothetical protein